MPDNCIHDMPPEWCGTCLEKKQHEEEVRKDKEFLNNIQEWGH